MAFSAGVTVTGNPRLELDVGGSAKAAEYKGTDGNNVKFSYTVAENDEDTDGVSIRANKLTLNGGTIRGDADQDADLSHGTLAPQSQHRVDGIRPSFQSISFSASNSYNLNGYYEEGEEVFIKVQFSEGPIYVSGEPQLTIDVGGKEKKTTFERTGFGDFFPYTVQEGDLDLDGPSFSANSVSMNGGYIRDGAGNDIRLNHGGASANQNSKVDAVAPTISSISITSDPGDDDTYGAGDMLIVSAAFSEEVWVPYTSRSDLPGTRYPELDLRIGNDTRSAKSGFQELGKVVKFTYTIQPGDTDTDGVSINANALRLNGGIIFDAAGNNPISATIHNIPDIPIDAVVPHDAVADDSSHMVAGSSSSLTLRGPTTPEYKENSETQVGSVYTVSGTDANITWSLSGDDGSHFSLRGASYSKGLRFTSSPNYEDPRDANSDNEYGLTIEVSDGTNTSSLQVVVTVTNEWIDSDEVPVITGKAQVGQTLTADVSRISDHADSTFYYSWIRNDGTADTDIDGATNSTYTLTANDERKTIKVRVISPDYTVDLFSRTSAATVAVAAKPNTAPTGLPTINGTPQVGEMLTASTSDIDDADGMSGAAFTYQWLSSRDTEIQGATDRTYTLAATDKGKTIKVMVSFTDDAKNEESLTSAATAVPATVPDAPEHLNVSLHNTGALDLYWEAPASNGGSPVTGYKVQWKETAGSWDTPADVSETTVSGTTHTITGLTDGVEYTVRVIASNDVGDGLPSGEATGTPRETTPLELATATVDGTTLALTYDEALDGASEPAADTFSVTVGGVERTVDGVAVAGDTVTLTLVSGVTADDTVTVSYTAPTDAAASRIRDEAGNAAASFSGQAAVNNTPPPANTPPRGQPTISGTAQVGETLTAETGDIEDDDGLGKAVFTYQWLADDVEIAGASNRNYTLVDDDADKTIKVQVSFTDDRNHQESLTSEATAVVEAAAEEESSPTWSAELTVGRSGSYYGYWESEGFGELTPDEFNLEGKAYTVLTFLRYTDQWFIFTLDQALPGDFTLRVGGTTLSSDEASIIKTSSQAEYQWHNRTPDLSYGDTVEVSLTFSSGD